MIATREKVLRTLLANSRCTVEKLAEEVGISPISIRYHIASLQAEGLIASEEERHGGVGRPRQIFFLTEAGMEQFPTRYIRFTMRLLQQLKETMPPAMVNDLFTQMAEGLAEDLTAGMETKNLGMAERLNLAREIMRKEGFSLEWEQQGDQFQIREVNCPYYYVGQNHPEICAMDQILLSKMLSVPTSQIKCILNGDLNCTFVVNDTGSLEKPA